ncbi:MAG: hypothetical protein OXD33_03595 [Rhodobacteraceae bacterium]|nr:hypothetical protein [Paracoccaceae bacterium]
MAGKITPESLDLWSQTSFHLMGTLEMTREAVMFGASTRKGLIHPWADNPSPTGDLGDAEFASVTARWMRAFPAYGRSAEEVAGDVGLEVQLSDLSLGDKLFSDLQNNNGRIRADGNRPSNRVGIVSVVFENHGFSGSDTDDHSSAFLGRNRAAPGGGGARHKNLTAAFGGTG